MTSAGLRSADAAPNADRATYLRQVSRLLWPSPAMVSMGTEGDLHGAPLREFVVLPHVRRPRLLVPPEPAAGSAAVRNYGEPGSLTARLGSRLLSLLLASGSGGSLLRGRLRVYAPTGGDTIESYLATALRDQVQILGRPLPSRDLRISIHLTAARANRKPVLQILTAHGDPVGFAKVGVNPLTRELVRAEHEALRRLSRVKLQHVAAPRVLHYGQWNDLDVLILSPLPVRSRRRPLPPALLTAAMAEVARVDGLTDGPARGPYLRRLQEQLGSAGQTQDRSALLQALAAIGAHDGDTTLTYGSWHGDWTPWNTAHTRHGLLVWDWERFAGGVPLGFDALHHWLQSHLVGGHSDARQAATACIDRAAGLLAPLGVAAVAARVTATLYLSALATRYLVDRQADAGAPLGAPGTWLIPAIASEVTGR